MGTENEHPDGSIALLREKHVGWNKGMNPQTAQYIHDLEWLAEDRWQVVEKLDEENVELEKRLTQILHSQEEELKVLRYWKETVSKEATELFCHDFSSILYANGNSYVRSEDYQDRVRSLGFAQGIIKVLYEHANQLADQIRESAPLTWAAGSSMEDHAYQWEKEAEKVLKEWEWMMAHDKSKNKTTEKESK